VFPASALGSDWRAADLGRTAAGGVYCAGGVGGPITGRGADIGLIDDPVKSRESADSEIIRDKTWDWYVNDFYTRLHPGAAVIVITTRWHDDDLAGRLLTAQETDPSADRWHVIHHPALDENDNPLWPPKPGAKARKGRIQGFSADELKRKRANMTQRAWMALYQGDPAPETGTFFEADWFKRGQPPPAKTMRMYAASDMATKYEAGDYTVHGVFGLDQHDRLWLLDLWRRQTTADLWAESMVAMSAKWKPMLWLGEKGQIEGSVGPFLNRMYRERGVLQRRELLSSHADKPTKARAIQAWASQYGLWLPYAAPWADSVIQELLRFPLGVRDDVVDVFSLMGRFIEIMRAREAATAKPKVVSISTRLPTLNEMWKDREVRRLSGA